MSRLAFVITTIVVIVLALIQITEAIIIIRRIP
jgi:hypothetical protein